MAKWVRRPQGSSGEKYFFPGSIEISSEISAKLSLVEILTIFRDLKTFVKEQCGVNKVQEYEDEKGRTLLFVDHSGWHAGLHDQHSCTLKFNYEA